MAKKTTLNVQNTDITILLDTAQDYFSLTDIAKRVNERSDMVISNWLRNRNTVEFLGVWEQLNNPNFNPIEFDGIKSKTGLNSFMLTVKEWQEKTGAIGIVAKSGRYGGTYAHKDIALAFCYWVSPTFQLYLIKEFDRLKQQEAIDRMEALDWSLKRTLAKVNYRIHTDAVREHLIPPRIHNTKGEGLYFATEADLLNLALFGVTAKQWRENNPDLKGNVRDYATTEQLLVLSNLENLNAEFIKQGMNTVDRLNRLNEIAIHQMGLLLSNTALKQLGEHATKGGGLV